MAGKKKEDATINTDPKKGNSTVSDPAKKEHGRGGMVGSDCKGPKLEPPDQKRTRPKKVGEREKVDKRKM